MSEGRRSGRCLVAFEDVLDFWRTLSKSWEMEMWSVEQICNSREQLCIITLRSATMPTSARYCACPDCHISIHAKANTIIHTPAFLVVTSILTWCRIVSGYFRLRAKHSTFQDKKIRVKKSSSTSLGRKKKP